MSVKMTSELQKPTGVVARATGGNIGVSTFYYWIQAIYPSGKSDLAQSNLVTSGNPSNGNPTNVEWNAMSGAIGYLIFRSTSSVMPTITGFMASVTSINFSDNGSITPSSFLVVRDGLRAFQARYDSSVDSLAQGVVTLASSDIIPKGIVILGGFINATTAFTSGGSATVAIGTLAGSSATSFKTATAISALSLDAVVVPTAVATPFKMTADGQVTVTIATADLLAGVADIILLGAFPIAL